jgi:hypothetical protein
MSQKPLVENAANEEQLSVAKEKLRHSKNRQDNRWKKALYDHDFCTLLLDLVSELNVEESPAISNDHFETYRRIGLQAAGRKIVRQLKAADLKKYYEVKLKHEEGIR